MFDADGAVDRDVTPLQADVACAAIEKLIAGECATVRGGVDPDGLQGSAAIRRQMSQHRHGFRCHGRLCREHAGWHVTREDDAAEPDAARHRAGLLPGRAVVGDLEHVVDDHQSGGVAGDRPPLQRRGSGRTAQILLVGPVDGIRFSGVGRIRHEGRRANGAGRPHREAGECRRLEPGIAGRACRGAERDVLHRDAREGRSFGLNRQRIVDHLHVAVDFHVGPLQADVAEAAIGELALLDQSAVGG